MQARLDAALALASNGFQLVEMLEGHKEPLGREWQKLGMTDAKSIARVLRRRSPARQLGAWPPPGSGLLVIDFDKRQAFEQLRHLLPDTLMVHSSEKEPGWRGVHVYAKLPAGVNEADVPRTFAGGEVRVGGSGQVVAPWGRHPSGALYEPLNGTLAIGQASAELIAALRGSHAAKTGAQRAARGPDDAGWTVAEPGRHDFLVARGRNLRGHGLSGPRLLDELRRLNAERCEPPKADEEVAAIAEWIEGNIGDDPPRLEAEPAPNKAAALATPAEPRGSIERTDLGNARLFARGHSETFRFVVARRKWLAWDGTRWRPDADDAAWRAAKGTADRMAREALRLAGNEQKAALRHALASQSEPALRRMLLLAGSEAGIALTPEALDTNPWLLTCANGTIDLTSGELRPPDPDDLISLGSEVAFDPDAACPRWERFLTEVFDGDEELILFVQRAVGYSLTGDVGERVLFICHGTGFNGKSTLLEDVLKPLLGTLAETASFDTFTRMRRSDGPRNDLARLHRARLVTAVESAEGRRLDEAIVKHLTGGDAVAARFLYGEFFDFRPRFKIWLATNHRPRIDGGDDAIWDRIRLIPFEVNFRGRGDAELKATLRSELPGILAWAVRGCLAWQRDGLGGADAVAAATGAYRAEEDILGAFLAERCIVGSRAEAEAGALREAFDAFCTELGERPMPGNLLGKQLVGRGFHAEKSTGGRRMYRGVGLMQVESERESGGSGGSGGTFHNSLRARANEEVVGTAATGATTATNEHESTAATDLGERYQASLGGEL